MNRPIRSNLTAVLAGVLAALVAAFLLAGCGSHPAASTTTPARPAAPAASASPAEPDTAAGAVAAAQRIFELYAAQQWSAVYTYVTPSARSQVSETVFAGAHEQCTTNTTGLSYTTSDPVLTGTTAVVTESLAGVAGALGSEAVTLDYVSGQWLWQPSPTDLAEYRSTVAATVAVWKAAGQCS